MATSRKVLKSWDPVTSATLWRESVSHVVLLAVGLSSGLGYLGVMALLGAELLLLTLLSIAVYPERGLRAHLVSLVTFVGLLAFLGIFVVTTYGVAMEPVPGFEKGETPFHAIRLDRELVLWMLGYSAAHMLGMFLYTRTRPNPRAAWSEGVLMQGSATMMTVFVMIIASMIIAAPLMHAIHWFVPLSLVAAECLLIVLLVLVHFGMSLVISKMPQSTRDEIAANPYVE